MMGVAMARGWVCWRRTDEVGRNGVEIERDADAHGGEEEAVRESGRVGSLAARVSARADVDAIILCVCACRRVG